MGSSFHAKKSPVYLGWPDFAFEEPYCAFCSEPEIKPDGFWVLLPNLAEVGSTLRSKQWNKPVGREATHPEGGSTWQSSGAPTAFGSLLQGVKPGSAEITEYFPNVRKIPVSAAPQHCTFIRQMTSGICMGLVREANFK